MRWWLPAAVVLLACQQPGRCIGVTGGAGGGEAFGQPTTLFIAGHEVVRDSSAPTAACGLDRNDVRVSVDVATPSGELRRLDVPDFRYVPSEGVVSASVRLTPEEDGDWFLTTTYEPSLGRLTEHLRVARDGLSTPRTSEVVRPACVKLWRTSSGAVICEEVSSTTVLRGGATVQTLFAVDVEVAGDAVWGRSLQGYALSRWHDEGDGGLVLDGTVDIGGAGFQLPGAFTTKDLAVRHSGGSLVSVRWDGGVLAPEPQPVVVNDLDGLLVDEGRLWVVRVSVCPIDASACRVFANDTPLKVVGADALAFWFLTGTGELLRVPRPLSGTEPVARVSLPEQWALPLARADERATAIAGVVRPVLWSPAPVAGADVVEAEWVDGGIRFTALRAAQSAQPPPNVGNGAVVLPNPARTRADFLAR